VDEETNPTDQLKPLIEAALYVSGKEISVEELAKICSSGNPGAVRQAAEELLNEYKQRSGGLEILQTEKGFEMKVRKVYENKVMHLVPEADMPGAVLKTLALIACKQPIKQSEVIKVRGNGAYRYIKRLKEQELIESTKSSITAILRTTPKFKDYFQLHDMRPLMKEETEIVIEEKSCAQPETTQETQSETPVETIEEGLNPPPEELKD